MKPWPAWKWAAAIVFPTIALVVLLHLALRGFLAWFPWYDL